MQKIEATVRELLLQVTDELNGQDVYVRALTALRDNLKTTLQGIRAVPPPVPRPEPPPPTPTLTVRQRPLSLETRIRTILVDRRLGTAELVSQLKREGWVTGSKDPNSVVYQMLYSMKRAGTVTRTGKGHKILWRGAR
jgi:hypothetical protein